MSKCDKEGNPKTDKFCYEFWERVAIDMGESYETDTQKRDAELNAIIRTRRDFCSKCERRNDEA